MDIFAITGQTATGKTALALELAKKHNGELINFDSRQVYEYLDIITGKDLPKTAIHLYDVVTPDKFFSSYDFISKARPIIDNIQRRGKTPILVGGTYLYLKHLLYGFDVTAEPDYTLRNKLNQMPLVELQDKLIKMSKNVYEKMNNSDQNNPRRLIRRIEIILSNKKNLTKKQAVHKPIKPSVYIGICYKNKEDLIIAIKTRVAKRIEQGAIDEVKSILKKGFKSTDPGLKTIGYRELIDYLNNKITYEEAIEKWTNHEVQYAKRQYTFMKKDKNISWKFI